MLTALGESFIGANMDKLPSSKVNLLRQRMACLSEAQLSGVVATPMKKPLIALLLSLFLGYWGVDRFYIGHAGLGVMKLFFNLFGGIFFIPKFLSTGFPIAIFLAYAWLVLWLIYDIFFIWSATKRANLDRVNKTMITIYQASGGQAN